MVAISSIGVLIYSYLSYETKKRNDDSHNESSDYIQLTDIPIEKYMLKTDHESNNFLNLSDMPNENYRLQGA